MGLAVGLISVYLGTFNVSMIFSTVGVALSLVFVSIDSQMMIQKKHYGIGYDDYLLGAIMLYADFINLFLLPISLCLKRR